LNLPPCGFFRTCFQAGFFRQPYLGKGYLKKPVPTAGRLPSAPIQPLNSISRIRAVTVFFQPCGASRPVGHGVAAFFRSTPCMPDLFTTEPALHFFQLTGNEEEDE
jgi:hypothetical protein